MPAMTVPASGEIALLTPLLPHPALPAPAGVSLAAGVEALPGRRLRLRYVLRGDPGGLSLPAAGAAMRVDGLWQHTCCEAFVAVPGAAAYREFNFSPSGAWAAYAFDDYRGAAALPPGPVPSILLQRSGDALTLSVELAAAWLPPTPRLALGLSAVIETRDAARSYWALAHPAPQPDFHHRAGFTLALDLPA